LRTTATPLARERRTPFRWRCAAAGVRTSRLKSLPCSRASVAAFGALCQGARTRLRRHSSLCVACTFAHCLGARSPPLRHRAESGALAMRSFGAHLRPCGRPRAERGRRLITPRCHRAVGSECQPGRLPATTILGSATPLKTSVPYCNGGMQSAKEASRSPLGSRRVSAVSVS
jgi:hypothetical protein